MESIRKKNARFQDYWDKKYSKYSMQHTICCILYATLCIIYWSYLENKKGETLRGTSWTKLEPFRNPSISDSNLEYGRPIISKDIDFDIDGNIKFKTPESVDVQLVRKKVTFAGSDNVIILPTTESDSQ